MWFKLVVAFAWLAYGIGAMEKDIPAISSDFECYLEEEDSTGEVILLQSLVWSASQRRSRMSAEGSLVKGGLQQIKRCDLLPADGWFTNEGGPNAKDPSTWTCTNTTIQKTSELPANCAYGEFWALTGAFDVRYDGVQSIRSKKCDMWSYKAVNPNDNSVMDMFFATLKDQAVPCATGRHGVYTIFVDNFRGQDPSIQDFDPIAGTGITCPAASPARAIQNMVEVMSLGSLHGLLHKATILT